ncbi:MAG: hypothetical protein CAPSK01_004287 [Candidatus Accumulibacter vicinus]|uniref:Uncharacterized protein n=1 Tax=Candidatus Accumulibacter vicinus TaxID=2954382 RepID=A0A084XVA4_9PROT|nr:MAG: hypothetical protein CAPSK01_004287 [Candidatus Accumulibacter vicinus]
MHRAHDKRQADEDQRQQHPVRGVRDLDSERLEQFADRAVLRVDGCQGDAGHRRRQGKRQVHQSIDQALAGKAVAYQHPGKDQAENDIDAGRQQRGAKAELI